MKPASGLNREKARDKSRFRIVLSMVKASRMERAPTRSPNWVEEMERGSLATNRNVPDPTGLSLAGEMPDIDRPCALVQASSDGNGTMRSTRPRLQWS